MNTKNILLLYLLLVVFFQSVKAQNGVVIEPSPSAPFTNWLRPKNCIETDAANNVYVGFTAIGLGRYTPSTSSWVMFDTSNSGIPANRVKTVAIDNNGNVWAGTFKGLAKYDGTNWTVYNTQTSGIVCDTIQCLKKTPTGIWCGTNRGLSFFDGSTWTNYTTTNSGIHSDNILSLDVDSSYHILVGNSGLSVFDGSTWTNYTPANSDLPGGVLDIEYISSKTTWLMTGDGLCKLSFGNIINKRCDYNLPKGTSYFERAKGIAKKNNKVYAFIDQYTLVRIDEDENIEALIDSVGPAFNTGGFFQMTFDSNGIMWVITFAPNGCTSFHESLSSGFVPANSNQFSSARYIDINQVAALVCNNGCMFFNQTNINSAGSQYEVPKCNGKTPIYTSGLWLGGYDAGGTLHISAQTYRQAYWPENRSDYWTGPLDTINGTTDTATVEAYNNVWKINKTTIDDFKINFLNGNVTNGTYTIPFEIATYPGSGNGNYTRSMSPFTDYNGDGIYNPFDGDYPLIKGDQQLYWIFNDMYTHTETGGIPLGVEIRGYAYGYNCDQYELGDSSGAINYTTFYRYEITNRSSNTYDSVFIGLFTDTDLGDAFDDYVGCDTVLNTAFTYNGDNDDGSGTPDGYGLNPPMINCQVLQGPEPVLNDGIDNDHDGTVDELGELNMMTTFHPYNSSGFLAEPNSPINFYRYLTSRFLDGSHITYGQGGYGGVIPTNYFYSGLPYSGLGWDEITENHQPDDKRLLLSSGPFHLTPGETKSIDYAYVFTRDSTAANGLNTSIARNSADLQKVKYWFDNNNFPSCVSTSVETIEQQNADVNIYPNPTDDYLNIVCKGITSNIQLKIYDIAGREVLSKQIKNMDKVDVRFLTTGVYLVKIITDKNIVSKKFIRR